MPARRSAFAVADHQLAHVYVQHGADVAAVKRLLEGVDGIDRVLDEAGKREAGLDHPRSGELVALAAAGPLVQLLLVAGRRQSARLRARPSISTASPATTRWSCSSTRPSASPKLAIGWRLAKRKLGFRKLLDVIPIRDTTLVKGSHGLITDDPRPGRW